MHEEKGGTMNVICNISSHWLNCPLGSIPGHLWLTLFASSTSSSLMELEGEGVADLLAGGEGDVWGTLAPPKFKPSCALSWDWLMVVSWAGGMIPERAASVMWTMDLMIMEGSWRYCDTCVWLWSYKEKSEGERSLVFPNSNDLARLAAM